MRTRLALLLPPALVLAACGARQPQVDQAPEISLQVITYPDPPSVGDAELTLELTDPARAPVQGAVLQVRGDMTHAGMAPVLAEAGEGALGRYPVDFEWTMAGDWILTIQGNLPDGRQLLRTYEIQVDPKPPSP